MRAAFQHLAWNPDPGLAGIEAVLCARPERVPRNTACLHRVSRMPVVIPVGGPLPDVANHVVESVAVRRVRADRRRSLESVAWRTLPGKFSLPDVRHVPILRQEFVAPRISGAVESSACGELPLGLRWKCLP